MQRRLLALASLTALTLTACSDATGVAGSSTSSSTASAASNTTSGRLGGVSKDGGPPPMPPMPPMPPVGPPAPPIVKTFAITSDIESSTNGTRAGDTKAVFGVTAKGAVTVTLPVDVLDTDGGKCELAEWTVTNLTTGQQVLKRGGSCTITGAGPKGLRVNFFVTTTIGPFPPGSYLVEYRVQTTVTRDTNGNGVIDPGDKPEELAFGFGSDGFMVYAPPPPLPMPVPPTVPPPTMPPPGMP